MMDFEFSSKEELYERVGPALRAKVSELRRLGYRNIKEMDVWNCLIQTKWLNSKNLMLSDIVDDILTSNNYDIYEYLKQIYGTHHFDSSLEIL